MRRRHPSPSATSSTVMHIPFFIQDAGGQFPSVPARRSSKSGPPRRRGTDRPAESRWLNFAAVEGTVSVECGPRGTGRHAATLRNLIPNGVYHDLERRVQSARVRSDIQQPDSDLAHSAQRVARRTSSGRRQPAREALRVRRLRTAVPCRDRSAPARSPTSSNGTTSRRLPHTTARATGPRSGPDGYRRRTVRIHFQALGGMSW
jgi:hypothetical protein